jgi:hypothetical protein
MDYEESMKLRSFSSNKLIKKVKYFFLLNADTALSKIKRSGI